MTMVIIAPHAATVSEDADMLRLILPVKRAIPLLAVLIICSGRIGLELRPRGFHGVAPALSGTQGNECARVRLEVTPSLKRIQVPDFANCAGARQP